MAGMAGKPTKNELERPLVKAWVEAGYGRSTAIGLEANSSKDLAVYVASDKPFVSVLLLLSLASFLGDY